MLAAIVQNQEHFDLFAFTCQHPHWGVRSHAAPPPRGGRGASSGASPQAGESLLRRGAAADWSDGGSKPVEAAGARGSGTNKGAGNGAREWQYHFDKKMEEAKSRCVDGQLARFN